MTPAPPLLVLLLLFVSISSTPSTEGTATAVVEESSPTPTAWPLQFHSLLYTNNSGELSVVDLWYDWPNSRNFNIIQHQLGTLLYDLEWDNGTSFYYTLDDSRHCQTYHFDVGILRPDWLDGANYLGQQRVDGFLCNVWEKVQFIWYYEDVETKHPVQWVFYTGRSVHVMTFEVGAVLEEAQWQAPEYCFEKKEGENPKFQSIISEGFQQSLMSKKYLKGP
uniref:Uncharacterized protein At4g14100 isoform X2 n=1 Tax=Elaeis guineensis var. tenera TaxID=51953 RepID=A0A6J0PAL6_ELAGV|nr:uncharacterized protein At4g14100 isoform X2 [Elaeis guineensis]